MKAPLVQALDPDLLVLQEIAHPAGDTGWLWFGDNPRQGIGIFARQRPLRILPEAPGVPRYAIPVEIGGPRPFIMLAVWAQQDRVYPYVRAVIRAVELYRDLIAARSTVIIGDFNSNAIWDKTRQGSRDHSYLVGLLAELGLVSSYHSYFGEPHGAETRPTLYFQWKEHKPYHIDYCFIPIRWLPHLIRVEVGEYEGWKQWSDHRPLLVELEL